MGVSVGGLAGSRGGGWVASGKPSVTPGYNVKMEVIFSYCLTRSFQ